MSDFILIFVTCASLEEAEAIASDLLERHLVACASIGGPVRSRYWWQGKLEASAEIGLVLKSRRDRFPDIEGAIRRLHSYEVPEIVAVALAEGSAPYLAWLDQALKPF